MKLFLRKINLIIYLWVLVSLPVATSTVKEKMDPRSSPAQRMCPLGSKANACTLPVTLLLPPWEKKYLYYFILKVNQFFNVLAMEQKKKESWTSKILLTLLLYEHKTSHQQINRAWLLKLVWLKWQKRRDREEISEKKEGKWVGNIDERKFTL